MKYFIVLLAFSLSLSHAKAQSPCLANDTLNIVVIGSSTAAGAGASPDSSWVNRYRHFMQGINPANQVINLARGGYNTWRLMPDYYTPPSNRPNPDSLRNISHALRQNPDAIIINLPSNDAAIGTGINEQMSNFIHMDSLAQSQGVPFWVCTTQPRNLNASQIAVQLGVRDSIHRYFGTKAIDFWNGLANANNTIDSIYDSGDGVHVNNAGHRLLFKRVVQKQIPDTLVSGLPGIDIWTKEIQWLNASDCGQSQSVIQVDLANLRYDSLSSAAQIQLIREDLITGISDTLSQNLNSLAGCSFGQVQFIINTSPQLDWRLRALNSHAQDMNAANDLSSWLYLSTKSQPSIISSDSTFCRGDSLTLAASSSDSIIWFADSSLSQALHSGTNYPYGLAQNDTLYLQARRGPFYFQDQVISASSSNISWNGTMFNLIAGSQNVILDSLIFYSGSNADLQINLRTRIGSYQGFEDDPNAWGPILSDSIFNALSDSAYVANFGTININAGDTLACYLYLENAAHRLRYQSAGAMTVYQGDELGVQVGSGIAHTFGTIYHPRHVQAEFFYHYGSNPLGQCQSEVEPVILKESESVLDLGSDTLHDLSQNLVLSLPPGFSHAYWWLSPQSGDSLIIPAFSYNDSDSLWIVLSALDSLGCSHTDSLLVTFILTFDLDERKRIPVSIYPNPATNQIWIEQSQDPYRELSLVDSRGQMVIHRSLHDKKSNISLDLKPGLYFIFLDSVFYSKLVLQ